VAHLVGINGQGIARCDQSMIRIPVAELRAIASASEAGKRHLATFGDSDPALTVTPSSMSRGGTTDSDTGVLVLVWD